MDNIQKAGFNVKFQKKLMIFSVIAGLTIVFLLTTASLYLPPSSSAVSSPSSTYPPIPTTSPIANKEGNFFMVFLLSAIALLVLVIALVLFRVRIGNENNASQSE
jgi:hypothetical protein